MNDYYENLANKLQNELNEKESKRQRKERRESELAARKEQIAAQEREKKEARERYREALKFVATCRPGPHLKGTMRGLIKWLLIATVGTLSLDLFLNRTSDEFSGIVLAETWGILLSLLWLFLMWSYNFGQKEIGTHFIKVNKELVQMYAAHLKNPDLVEFMNGADKFYRTSIRSTRTLDNMIQKMGHSFDSSFFRSEVFKKLLDSNNPRGLEMLLRGFLRRNEYSLMFLLTRVPLNKIPNGVLEDLPYDEQKQYLIEFINAQQSKEH